MRGLVLNRAEYDEDQIREYVESQAPDEHVTHLEKVKTEQVFQNRHDAWDVWTDKSRYWVLTTPTNLYQQELFPSLDYAITLHVGVTTRIMAQQDPGASQEERYRLAGAFRRWKQAADSLDPADEAEEFQAVGSRCRTCLLELVRSIADSDMVPEGQERPKGDDFIRWSSAIADTIAHGHSAERVRGYLKAQAKGTWELVNWLVHAEHAVRFDGQLAVDATGSLLAAFGAALVRYERGTPDRCGTCGAYRLTSVYRPDLDVDPPFAILCESCGATAVRPATLHPRHIPLSNS